MTPLGRLAIFAAGATIWAAIAAAWVFVSPWVGVAAAAGGLVSALVATLERVPRPTPAPPAEQRRGAPPDDDTFRLRHRDRAEIERDARAAEDDD